MLIPGKKSHSPDQPAETGAEELSLDANPVMEAVAGLAGLSGGPSESFFDQCVRLLAAAYQADYAFVATLEGGAGNRVAALAVWARGDGLDREG